MSTTSVAVGGVTTTFDVEAAHPHRLVRWASSTGEQGVLRGVMRNAYWKHNDPAGRALLAEIGLQP